MVGKVIGGGLAALGLIGGVGTVAWHDGGATVKVKDSNGVEHSTEIQTDGGASYRCPAGEKDKVASIVEEMGRIKITIESVNPTAEPTRYDELVREYNADVDEYNATLEADCEAA